MNESIAQGVELMLTGMGIVFLFLVMLIGAVNFMASLVSKFFPEEEVQPASAAPRPVATQAAGTPAVTAAISAAVHQYKAKQK